VAEISEIHRAVTLADEWAVPEDNVDDTEPFGGPLEVALAWKARRPCEVKLAS